MGLALETVGLGRQVKPKTGKVWNLVNQDLIFQKGLQELPLKICCVCSKVWTRPGVNKVGEQELPWQRVKESSSI